MAALGLVNALGCGADEVWPRVLDGDQSGIAPREGFVPGRALQLGVVESPLPRIPERLARYDCRNNAFSLAALEQIGDEIEAALSRHGRERIGVVMGTSTSGSAECEVALAHLETHDVLAPGFDYPQLEFGGTAGYVAEQLRLRGPAFTLSTACSSSARALASARSLLALGICDAVIAGGSDSLCGLTTGGFSALQAVSDAVSNPMSANRAGLTLGEGAAVFLVTREPDGIQLRGVGESSEAHHMSAPDPEGRGASASMRGALDAAGLAASDVAYLNLHGTGTKLNDAMESAAVAQVLGDQVPCSSTKPLVGHTLGAAGAMELAFCWLALTRSPRGALRLPPHCWDGMRDPELAPIRLVEKGLEIEAPSPRVSATNSFGFGGNNCTLVICDEGGGR